MGNHRAIGATRRAVGSVVAAGTIPLIATLISAGTANAEALPASPALSPIPATLPTHPLLSAPNPVMDPFHEVTTTVQQTTQVAIQSVTDTITAATEPFIQFTPAAAPNQPLTTVVEPAPRPLSNHAYLAPQGASHAPMLVSPVAAIKVPPGVLRIGDIVVNVPFDARQINQGVAQTESELATFLDSMGVEHSRSDRIAAQTLTSATVGAAVANAVVSPLSITTALVGAAAGFIVGIPFLPTGLVIGPVLGAAVGYAIVAVPAMIAGAALGGAIGATDGFTTTPFGTPPQ